MINYARKDLMTALSFIFVAGLVITLVAGLLMTLLSGCTGMQRWVQDNPKTALGIGAGVATGGLAGGLIGSAVGETATGLLIGSGLGGAAGGLIGSAVEDRGTPRRYSSSSPSANYSSRSYARYDPAVAELQKSLGSMGYDCGPIDGIMGARTRRAIMNFQRNQDLTVDGIAGPITRARLSQVKTSGYKDL